MTTANIFGLLSCLCVISASFARLHYIFSRMGDRKLKKFILFEIVCAIIFGALYLYYRNS